MESSGERVSAWRDQRWPAGAPGTRRRTVLIVSSDSNLCTAAGRVLENHGFHVTTAAHSGHALLACITGNPIDAALIDAIPDDISAPALADTLRRHCPDLRVVFLAEPETAIG